LVDLSPESSVNRDQGETDRRPQPSLIEQLRLVAWLRLRSLRNGLRNKNRRMDLLGIVVSGLFSSLLVIGVTIGLFVGTKYIFDEHHQSYLGLLFLGLLIWWQLFPILLAGFAAQFSFRSLLRFPLSFSAFYVLGLVYGLADAAAIAAVIWMGAMIAGTLAAQPGAAPAMLLACVFFAALNITVERLLGAWLEKMLSKRRAKELMFTIFVLSMVSLQFLNPVLQKHGAEVKAGIQRVLPYLWLLPSAFAGSFVAKASAGQWGAALLQLAGLAMYVVLFGLLLWHRYAQLYSGEELSEGTAPERRAKAEASDDLDDRDSLGFLPPQIGAVFRKEINYLKRNTFLFFSLLIPPLMVFFFSMQFAGTSSGPFKQGITPERFFPGMMAYLVLMLVAPSYNSFAHESRGIQTYFMSPVRFREILLGKNLMTMVIVLIELSFCVMLVGFRVGFPSTPVTVATLMAVAFSVVSQLTIANWSSIRFPKRMDFGKMQGQRNSGMSVLLMFGVQLVLAGISALILLSGQSLDSPWLPAEVFTVLAAAAVAGYFASLDSLTELAEKKKETLMETLCR
jgi:ABC-2 type transport system permease protein